MTIKKNTFAMEFTNFFQKKQIIYTKQKIPKYFYPNADYLTRSVLYRKKLNMNTFILVCGGVRTSKSYFALKFGDKYERIQGNEFNVRDQCSFDILPFLKWSKKSTGSIFILDECSNTLNPAEWYEAQSKIMRNFIFAQGFRGNVLMLVMPNVSYLLKPIRLMGNYVVETIRQGLVKVYRLNMRYSFGKGYLERLGTLSFNLPKQKIIDDYERMKKEWNDKHLKEDIDLLENLDTPTEKEIQKQEYYRLRNEKLKYEVKLLEEMDQQKPLPLLNTDNKSEHNEI